MSPRSQRRRAEPPARGVSQIGYASVRTAGIRTTGQITEADLAAEKAMRQMIARRYPHHAVLGEELGVSASPNERYRWILDPLDGTTWFVLGVPICGMVTMLTGERDGAIFGGSLVSSCGESLHREIVALAVPVALHDGPQRLVRPLSNALASVVPAVRSFAAELVQAQKAPPATRFNSIVSPYRVFETRRFLLDEFREIRRVQLRYFFSRHL